MDCSSVTPTVVKGETTEVVPVTAPGQEVDGGRVVGGRGRDLSGRCGCVSVGVPPGTQQLSSGAWRQKAWESFHESCISHSIGEHGADIPYDV